MNSRMMAMRNGTSNMPVDPSAVARRHAIRSKLEEIVSTLDDLSPDDKYPEVTVVIGMCEVVRNMTLCSGLNSRAGLLVAQLNLAKRVWDLFAEQLHQRRPMHSAMSAIPVDSIDVTFDGIISLLRSA